MGDIRNHVDANIEYSGNQYVGSSGSAPVEEETPSCTPAVKQAATAVANAVFPINAADFATLCGVPAMTPSHIFACQETSGILLDSIDNEQLVQKLVNGSTHSMGVATSGLNGPTRTAIRLTEGTDEGFSATRADLMSPFEGSCGWLLMYQMPVCGASRVLAGYGEATTTSPTEEKAGILTTVNSNGLIGASFSDGTTTASGSLVGGTTEANGWHFGGTVYNNTTGDCTTYTESAQHVRSLSSFTWIEMRSHFTIGMNRLKAAGIDIAYLVLFEGAAAEAVTLAGINAFHTQAVA